MQTSLKIYERELIRIMKTLSYNLTSDVGTSSAYKPMLLVRRLGCSNKIPVAWTGVLTLK
jgi:hypothetical protein